jgi:hypothetical protein
VYFCFFSQSQIKRNTFIFLAGIFTGIAYLVKLYGLLPLVFFSVCFVYKIIKEKKIDFNFFYIIFGLFIILVIEDLFFYSKTKDFFLRFHKEFSYYTEKERLVNEFNTDLSFYPNVMFGSSNQYFGLFFFFEVFAMMILLLKKI